MTRDAHSVISMAMEVSMQAVTCAMAIRLLSAIRQDLWEVLMDWPRLQPAPQQPVHMHIMQLPKDIAATPVTITVLEQDQLT